MAQTYDEYFNTVLDYELNQEAQYGDLASADDYRKLRHKDGKRYVNESIEELVQLNPSKFETDWIYTFDSAENTFQVPDCIQRILSIQINNKWTGLPDSSDLASAIRSTSADTIVNTEGWDRGDQITLKVVKYPDRIVNDDDLVLFPRGNMRLLTLLVKKKAFIRVGKRMSQIEYSEYMELRKMYADDISRVSKKARLAFRGKAFGRRY